MTDKRLKGKLTISRVDGTDHDGHVRIRLIDASSSVGFVDIDVPFETFAQALTGLGFLEVDYSVRDLDKIGLQLETDNVNVRIPNGSTDEQIKKLVDDACSVHGWEPQYADAKNHHRVVKHHADHTGATYRILIRRWVPA